MNAVEEASRTKEEILYLGFNQDGSCLAVGRRRGFDIFSGETAALLHREDCGMVRLVEMLFRTSLVALVGSSRDEDATTMPGRQLTMWNTKSRSGICQLQFPGEICGVKMNHRRAIVLLRQKVHIFDLKTMRGLHVIDRSDLAPGLDPALAALCCDPERGLLAAPLVAGTQGAGPEARAGLVGVVDTYTLQPLGAVLAHRSPVRALCLNSTGQLLATASARGTVVRLWAVPSLQLLCSFRRGANECNLHSLSFAADSVHLLASTSIGTLHVFRNPKEALEMLRAPMAHKPALVARQVMRDAGSNEFEGDDELSEWNIVDHERPGRGGSFDQALDGVGLDSHVRKVKSIMMQLLQPCRDYLDGPGAVAWVHLGPEECNLGSPTLGPARAPSMMSEFEGPLSFVAVLLPHLTAGSDSGCLVVASRRGLLSIYDWRRGEGLLASRQPLSSASCVPPLPAPMPLPTRQSLRPPPTGVAALRTPPIRPMPSPLLIQGGFRNPETPPAVSSRTRLASEEAGASAEVKDGPRLLSFGPSPERTPSSEVSTLGKRSKRNKREEGRRTFQASPPLEENIEEEAEEAALEASAEQSPDVPKLSLSEIDSVTFEDAKAEASEETSHVVQEQEEPADEEEFLDPEEEAEAEEEAPLEAEEEVTLEAEVDKEEATQSDQRDAEPLAPTPAVEQEEKREPLNAISQVLQEAMKSRNAKYAGKLAAKKERSPKKALDQPEDDDAQKQRKGKKGRNAVEEKEDDEDDAQKRRKGKKGRNAVEDKEDEEDAQKKQKGKKGRNSVEEENHDLPKTPKGKKRGNSLEPSDRKPLKEACDSVASNICIEEVQAISIEVEEDRHVDSKADVQIQLYNEDRADAEEEKVDDAEAEVKQEQAEVKEEENKEEQEEPKVEEQKVEEKEDEEQEKDEVAQKKPKGKKGRNAVDEKEKEDEDGAQKRRKGKKDRYDFEEKDKEDDDAQKQRKGKKGRNAVEEKEDDEDDAQKRRKGKKGRNAVEEKEKGEDAQKKQKGKKGRNSDEEENHELPKSPKGKRRGNSLAPSDRKPLKEACDSIASNICFEAVRKVSIEDEDQKVDEEEAEVKEEEAEKEEKEEEEEEEQQVEENNEEEGQEEETEEDEQQDDDNLAEEENRQEEKEEVEEEESKEEVNEDEEEHEEASENAEDQNVEKEEEREEEEERQEEESAEVECKKEDAEEEEEQSEQAPKEAARNDDDDDIRRPRRGKKVEDDELLCNGTLRRKNIGNQEPVEDDLLTRRKGKKSSNSDQDGLLGRCQGKNGFRRQCEEPEQLVPTEASEPASPSSSSGASPAVETSESTEDSSPTASADSRSDAAKRIEDEEQEPSEAPLGARGAKQAKRLAKQAAQRAFAWSLKADSDEADKENLAAFRGLKGRKGNKACLVRGSDADETRPACCDTEKEDCPASWAEAAGGKKRRGKCNE